MTAATLPLQLLLLTVSGWVHRHQQDVIAYLVEENRVLKEQLRGRRLRLTDDQRRRLAAKAKRLGRRALDAVATLVTPDTLMRWHRRLIAWKWTYVAKRVGRPGLRRALATLIVRMARENDRWGYCRIQGELRKLEHRVAASTIGKVLKDHGIRPTPDRPTSWRTFLRAHWGEVAGPEPSTGASTRKRSEKRLKLERVARPRGSSRNHLQSLLVRPQSPPLLSRGSQVRILPGVPISLENSRTIAFSSRGAFCSCRASSGQGRTM